MSGSISVNFSVNVVNGSYSYNWLPQTTSTQAAQGAVAAVASIPTSVTNISLSGVSTPGYLFVQSLDPTDGTGNYVDIGDNTGASFRAFARLYPGQIAAIPLYPSVVLAFQAHTAAVEVSYHVESA